MQIGKLPTDVSTDQLQNALATSLTGNETLLFACKVRFLRTKIFVATSNRCLLLDPSKFTVDKECAINEIKAFKIVSEGFQIKFPKASDWVLNCDKDDRFIVEQVLNNLGIVGMESIMNAISRPISKPSPETQKIEAHLSELAEKHGPILAEVPGFGLLDQGIELYKSSVRVNGSFREIDVHTVAEVISNGQVQVTTRPTLARMALLAPIPGSALIPGLALAKDKKHDLRVAEIVIASLDWQATARIKPGDVSKATAVANRINATANLLATSTISLDAAPLRGAADKRDVSLSSELASLNDLFESGVLSEDEFNAAKAKIIGM